MGRRAQGLVAALLLAATALAPAPAEAQDNASQPKRDVDWFAAQGKGAVAPLMGMVAKHDALGPFADSVWYAVGKDSIDVALALLAKDEQAPALRAAAARVLGSTPVDGRRQLEALLALLRDADEDESVKRAATVALGRLGRHAAEALPVLLERARPGEQDAEAGDGDVSALLALGGIVRDLSIHGAERPTRDEKAAATVARGLDWLARHQDEDGKWDPGRFDQHAPESDRNRGYGEPRFAAGVTGLALLAFLQAGPPERHTGTVHRAARYLVKLQDADGYISAKVKAGHYNHAIATWALAEAWRRTRDPRYLAAARKGVRYLETARNPGLGWRYTPKEGSNDTSITAWAVHALRGAELAGIAVDPAAYTGAIAWFDRMTHGTTGVVGYTSKGGLSARPTALVNEYPARKTRSCTAAAIAARLAAGQSYGNHELLRKGLWECAKLPPVWDVTGGRCDPYYWLHGTWAMYHSRCRAWADWKAKLRLAALRNQYKERSGQRSGSWDPNGPWQYDGGRVYTTAVMILCVQCITGQTTPLTVPVSAKRDCQDAAKLLRHIRDDDREPAPRREAARRALVGLG